MVIMPNDNIRKYISFENGKVIHDPDMPAELEEEFKAFVQKMEEVHSFASMEIQHIL